MPKRPDVRAGDIFRISVDGETVHYGQVVATRNSIVFVIVYAPPRSQAATVDFETIIEGEILFAAEVLGPLGWPISGRLSPDIERIGMPLYRESVDGDPNYVMNYEGDYRRAKPTELEFLAPHRFYSPRVLEDALKAADGIGPWHAAYDAMTYETHRRSQQVKWKGRGTGTARERLPGGG